MSRPLEFLPLAELDRIRHVSAEPPVRAALFAGACRINALYMITRAGSGHIGTSFSSIDVVTALHLNHLANLGRPERDVYFSSKGHDVPALYAVLVGIGVLPFDKLHALRRLGGLPGHPDVGTPGIEANTGSLGMGISKAKGMARANRLAGSPRPIFVLTGDGELQEGQFWESLVSATNGRFSEITVIVDHNKIQSDTWVARVSDLGDLERKLAAFGWHVSRIDGHDHGAIHAQLERLRAVTDRPKIVIADTVKGRGVSFMEAFGPEEKLYGFHSGAPDPETYARALEELRAGLDARLAALGEAPVRTESADRPTPPRPSRPQKIVAAYGEALVEAAAQNPRVWALDCDLVKDTGLVPFSERFPERFVECGIAEQDMVSQASGLALRGQLPVCHSFACFLSTRPNEQIYNNTTERRRVVYVGSLAGLVPGGPGHSHQCVRDIASLGGAPNLIMVEPATEAQTHAVVRHCLAADAAGGDSVYIRLVTPPWDVPFETPADEVLTVGRGAVLREGSDVLIVGYGPVLLSAAWHAAELLAARGVSVRLCNLPWLNRVDPAWLTEAIGDVRWVFTLDNHYVDGGQGDVVLRTLAELDRARPIRGRRLGVREIPACGWNDEVLAAHGLDAAGIAASVSAALGGSR